MTLSSTNTQDGRSLTITAGGLYITSLLCMQHFYLNYLHVGMCRNPVEEDAATTYGLSEAETQELRRSMPCQVSVASAGDVVGYDTFYLAHRCSCHGGMSGSPLRLLQQPLAIVGMHLGGGTCLPLILSDTNQLHDAQMHRSHACMLIDSLQVEHHMHGGCQQHCQQHCLILMLLCAWHSQGTPPLQQAWIAVSAVHHAPAVIRLYSMPHQLCSHSPGNCCSSAIGRQPSLQIRHSI